MTRFILLLSMAMLVNSLDTTSFVIDTKGFPQGFEVCGEDVCCTDATAMLQRPAQLKMREVDESQFWPFSPSPPPPDWSSCGPVADAVWAAMDSYKPSSSDYVERLKGAHWNLQAGYSVTNKTTPWHVRNILPFMSDTDYAGLWIKDKQCLLAFRGSDSQIDVGVLPSIMVPEDYEVHGGSTPGAPNGIQWSDVEFHGLEVHLGVKVELEAVLKKIQEEKGLAMMKEKCTGGLTLTGHSLGGGTSQLLATLLNKKGDPLGAGLTVDHLYGFGPMPFSKNTPAANDKSTDGCFAGGMYVNAEKKDPFVVDLVWQMLTDDPLKYKHAKTSHHLIFGPGDEMVTPCGQDAPYPRTGETVKAGSMMPMHSESTYVENVGC